MPPALRAWIEGRGAVDTVTADFIQTRSLRGLRMPLRSEGSMAFDRTGGFRWEVGTPPRMLVVGNPSGTILADLRKRTWERVEGSGSATALAVPRILAGADADEFSKAFEVVSFSTEDATSVARLRPIAGDMARFAKEVVIAFSARSGHPAWLVVTGDDGSSVRTEFTNVHVGAVLDDDLFEFDPDGFREVSGGRPVR